MDIILFHSGQTVIYYMQYCVEQIRRFNPDINIHLLTNLEKSFDMLLNKQLNYNVQIHSKEDYHTSDVGKFATLYKKDEDNFWTIAATRFFYIKEFIKYHNLKNVYHFENDVLLYYNLEEHHDHFIECFDKMAITFGGPDKCMTGFMFIPDWICLQSLCDFFINRLRDFSQRKLKKMYKLDMVNEMTLMRAFSKDHPFDLLQIPTMPTGLRHMFNSIFDPASWGQFVGGTQNEGPGAKPKDHYIGQLLIDHPEYTVEWQTIHGNKIPYFYNGDGLWVKINNLHIHSKNLQLYLSK